MFTSDNGAVLVEPSCFALSTFVPDRCNEVGAQTEHNEYGYLFLFGFALLSSDPRHEHLEKALAVTLVEAPVHNLEHFAHPTNEEWLIPANRIPAMLCGEETNEICSLPEEGGVCEYAPCRHTPSHIQPSTRCVAVS